MEIGNYVSEQLLMFLRAILLGGSLGLVYDLFGALRRLGGRIWGGVLDGLFCVLTVCALFLFTMAGDGEMRLFVLAGTLGGAVLFFCLLSRPLRPLWAFWLEILLSPVRLAGALGKKWGRGLKKLFSFCLGWVTIKTRHLRGGKPPEEQEGEERMEKRTEKRTSGGKQAPQKKRSSRLTVWVVALLLAGFGLQLYSMYSQLQTARLEEIEYARKLDELERANQDLREDIANSGDMSLIEDIARDQLGYVAEGEKVFQFQYGKR